MIRPFIYKNTVIPYHAILIIRESHHTGELEIVTMGHSSPFPKDAVLEYIEYLENLADLPADIERLKKKTQYHLGE